MSRMPAEFALRPTVNVPTAVLAAPAPSASVSVAKQRSLVFAAQHYLLGLHTAPPCRFDVVALDGERIEWLRAAFDAS